MHCPVLRSPYSITPFSPFFPSPPSSLPADYICKRAERSSRVLFLFTQAARVGALELDVAINTRLVTQKGTPASPASPASRYLYRCASLLPLSKVYKDLIPPLHLPPLLFDIIYAFRLDLFFTSAIGSLRCRRHLRSQPAKPYLLPVVDALGLPRLLTRHC